MYEIWELLDHELALVPLYLTQAKKLRKPQKHDLTVTIKAKLQVSLPKYAPIDDKKYSFVWFYDICMESRNKCRNIWWTDGCIMGNIQLSLKKLAK